jgi:hypothetical protein
MIDEDVDNAAQIKQADRAALFPGLITGPVAAVSADIDSLPDRQLQLFQPFHLWHTVTGFSRNAIFILSQKAASLTRAFLLTVFFIPIHLLFRGFVYYGKRLL